MVKIGDTLRVMKNDAGVPAGSEVTLLGSVPETGNLLVDVEGRKVSLLRDQLETLDGGRFRITGADGAAKPAPAAAHNGWLRRELYLDAGDAADELGVKREQLAAMTKALGVGRKKSSYTLYTAGDLNQLRRFAEVMAELQFSATQTISLLRTVRTVGAAKLEDLAALLP